MLHHFASMAEPLGQMPSRQLQSGVAPTRRSTLSAVWKADTHRDGQTCPSILAVSQPA